MKRYLFFFICFFNFVPCVKKGLMHFNLGVSSYAQGNVGNEMHDVNICWVQVDLGTNIIDETDESITYQHCTQYVACTTHEPKEDPDCETWTDYFPPPPPPPQDSTETPPDTTGGGKGGGHGDTTGPCGITGASVSADGDGSPGSDITLTASITTSGTPGSIVYFFDGSLDGGTTWGPVSTSWSSANTATFHSKGLGTYQFRVRVNWNCDGIGPPSPVASSTQSFDIGLCESDFIAMYSSDFDACWANTIASTYSDYTKSPRGSTKYEYGNYYKWDGSSDIYSKQDISNTASCSVADNITNTTVSMSISYNINAGSLYYIGKFHTHPLLTNCTISTSLAPGASGGDLSTASTYFIEIVRTLSTSISQLVGKLT